MGAFIDQLQKNNRDFISEKAKKQKEKEQRKKLENDLYIYFYSKFKNKIEYDPANLYTYYLQPDKKINLLKNYDFVTEYEKSKIYKKILDSVYTEYKNNYKYNINYTNIEEGDKKEYINYLKLKFEHLKYENMQQKNNRLKNNLKKEYKKGFLKIIGAVFIGGRVANKSFNNYRKKLK